MSRFVNFIVVVCIPRKGFESFCNARANDRCARGGATVFFRLIVVALRPSLSRSSFCLFFVTPTCSTRDANDAGLISYVQSVCFSVFGLGPNASHGEKKYNAGKKPDTRIFTARCVHILLFSCQADDAKAVSWMVQGVLRSFFSFAYLGLWECGTLFPTIHFPRS